MRCYVNGYPVRRTATRNQRRRKKLVQQKLMGLATLILCAVYVWLAFQGEAVEERDCTAILLIAPLALSLLFSKSIIII